MEKRMPQLVVAEVVTEIAASPQRVWEVFTDFSSYPDWSTYIEAIDGDLAGTHLRIQVGFPARRAFRAPLLEATPERRLAWAAGTPWLPEVLYGGVHEFVLVAQPDGGTRLCHREHYIGVLAPAFNRMMRGADRAFESFNLALKRRVEKLVAGDEQRPD
jgi:hypothetical protein